MKIPTHVAGLALPAVLFFASTIPTYAQTGDPTAVEGYSVSVFARGNSDLANPDSIAFVNNHVFIGYGDSAAPDGSDGKTSNIVEYTGDGQLVHIYTVVGHNDGLKVNPDNNLLYAMQNEDGHPNLVIIDPVSKEQTEYHFASNPPHGGGYDDMVFRNHRLYLSASNPSNNPNARPAIVEVFSYTNGLHVTATLWGNAEATNIATGNKVTLNLQDPDSMTLDPEGDIVLDSQADGELIIVRKPGASDQSVLQVNFTSPDGPAQADDSLFTPSGNGFVLVADTPNNVVYAIHKAAFAPGTIYTAAVGADGKGFVGKLDLDSGHLTPVVKGLTSPHGLGFVPTN